MSEVEFHFNAPDKVGYACRLLRKAYLKGARVVVLANPRDSVVLDQSLWTMGSGAFVPHCRAGEASRVRDASPILIADGPVPPDGFAAGVLLNLGDEPPSSFEQFARVIEVVTFDELDRQRARTRWKYYKSSGCEPQRHDLNLVGSAN